MYSLDFLDGLSDHSDHRCRNHACSSTCLVSKQLSCETQVVHLSSRNSSQVTNFDKLDMKTGLSLTQKWVIYNSTQSTKAKCPLKDEPANRKSFGWWWREFFKVKPSDRIYLQRTQVVHDVKTLPDALVRSSPSGVDIEGGQWWCENPFQMPLCGGQELILRVVVTGPPSTGCTSLVRRLTRWLVAQLDDHYANPDIG